MIFLIVALLSLFATGESARKRDLPMPILGGYFPNWAQYRPAPYTFTPTNLSPIVSKVNVIWYGFAFFCPDSSMIPAYWVTQLGLCQGKQPFQLTHPESKDPEFYSEIAAYKNQNSDLKFILSVGGWTFPSNYFSGMVSSKASRTTFINSCLSWMQQYNFDGIDLDWEYPCSPARTDEVKITCTDFDEVTDQGGQCPDDRNNLVLLVQEMREAFGDDYSITVAVQADMTNARMAFNFTEMAKSIDLFSLMSYDYTVSDISDSTKTAPNEPLYPPDSSTGLSQDCVSTTIKGYIGEGVEPSQIAVGLAVYGHTWYTPSVSGNDWMTMGVDAAIQGECCGPMKDTYGGKYGPGSQECGTLMYSEIKNAGYLGTSIMDNVTMSNIGYDSSTHMWVGFQDTDTVDAISSYGKRSGLAGAFLFDYSMDDDQWSILNAMCDSWA